jgi:N-acetylneuraminate synthase
LVTKENVRAIRPGLGLPIKFQNFILGKKVTKEIKRGTPVSWDIFG